MLPPLVQEADAAQFGLTVTNAGIARASARVRGHLGQRISTGTSTITARGPVFRLPERPVQSVASVSRDGAPVAFELEGSVLVVDSLERVEITYSHGYDELPDELVEMICQLASRLSAPADPSLVAGVQQQGAGSFSVSYGMDAWKGQAALTSAEKEMLARYWPRLPQPVVLGRASQ